MPFPGFTTKDFEAYQPHKWPSNAFNLERLQVKEKLAALGREIGGGLVSADGSPLAPELSTEHPALWNNRSVDCQYLFFSRNEAARRELDGIISRERTIASLIEDPSPLRNHILLCVRLDVDSVDLAVKLHSDAAVDRDNLQRKTQDYFHREKLLALLRGLPEGYEVGLEARGMLPCAGIEDEQLSELIADLSSADTWLTVRRRYAADDPAVAAPEFAGQIREALQQALLPLLHQIAWGRDNDFLSMSQTLRDKEVKKKSKGLAKSDRVRVVAGMFSGKNGVVEEVDNKGGLKVRLGKMSFKLSAEDVQKLGG